MSKQLLKCSCGHTWEHSGTGPTPGDLTLVCPICAAASPSTVDQASQTEVPEAARTDQLKPGQVLAGFEILEELNRGGMGVIYKAMQTGLNRLVALKVILPDKAGPETFSRFQREVRAAACLSHPNIVTVYHTDLDGPRPYLAMEYVQGIDLWRLVKRAGKRTVAEACFYVTQTAQGLQHAFERGLVHRDIKPANLMVTPSPLDPAPSGPTRKPLVKILDMGLARVTTAEDVGDAMTSLTHAGEFLGTPDYISPEQAEDPRQADIRSDIYSLGGTLYYLLVGKVPFPGVSMMQKLRLLLTGPTPSLLEFRPDVPPALETILKKTMARAPGDRYQTPAELIQAVDAVVKGLGGSGRAPRPAAAPASAPSAAPAAAPAANVAGSVRAHAGGVLKLSLSGDGKLLLSGGQDETLRLWNTARLGEVRCLAGDVGPIKDLCLSPNGKWAATCALRLFRSDMVVQLWDLATAKERRRLKGHTDTICCVAIAPDGRRVAAGSADKTIRVWAVDLPTSTSICLQGHTDQVSSLSFLPGGDALISASHDGSVRLWDSKTGAAKGNLNGQVGRIEGVAFAARTKRMGIAGSVLRVRQANGSFTSLHGHKGTVQCVAFSPDGQLLISGGSDHSVRLWNAADGTQLRCFDGHTDQVHAVAFSPDGRTAFSGGADDFLRCWPVSGR
jgi:hypothetical protein